MTTITQRMLWVNCKGITNGSIFFASEMFSAHVSSKILMIQKWINENHVDNSSFSVCTKSLALGNSDLYYERQSLKMAFAMATSDPTLDLNSS
ncbi:hypothetical protein MUK42_34506 [Musa troglodytarum]|uniref:Uncharacterized protein n=1 Tax=Musa troglodytarum TaxID=320322 RepID=A0A9E7HNE1_9LILI|nr:hypothetical protein MUK42_34506 [Musa troglodytarum]